MIEYRKCEKQCGPLEIKLDEGSACISSDLCAVTVHPKQQANGS